MPTSPVSDETGQPPNADVPDSDEISDTDEISALREELARTKERHLRAVADLDNYRKRADREVERRAAEERERVLRDWLEAVDSVERALRMEPGDPGLTAVLEQMDAILARRGVTRIETVGATFDPQHHEAIATAPAGDAADRTVLDEARSGFILPDGRILRPAQVVVAKGGS